jgi:hypothetical protein
LIPSVSKGTVLGTMVARWFGDWMYWFLCNTCRTYHYYSFYCLVTWYRITACVELYTVALWRSLGSCTYRPIQ